MGWYGPAGGVLDYSFVELMLGSKINGQDVQLCNWRHKLFRTNVEDLIPDTECSHTFLIQNMVLN
jgi:hypothetical protein